MQCSFASLEQNAASLVYKDLKKIFFSLKIFSTFKVNLKQINLNIYQNHENVLTLNQLIETHD